VGDELEVLVEVIEDDESVLEHEDGLGRVEGGGQGSSGSGLKVVDAVVGNHADRSTYITERCFVGSSCRS
jgi:hypothetical protein